MNEYETSKAFIPQSEEVDAYPYVIKLVSVNWLCLAVENPDSERKSAFVLAAAYSSIVNDDLDECRAIAKVSGISEECERAPQLSNPFNRPLHF